MSSSLNQTLAPFAFSWRWSSAALPWRSSQAWQRKRSRRSGWVRACSAAFWA